MIRFMPRKKTVPYPQLRYFECNLPRQIPTYYRPEIYGKLRDCVNLVYKRTEKLNAACDRMAGEKQMKPATFHSLAKSVFDLSPERFDAMSADKLCKVIEALYSGTDAPDRVDWPNAVVLFDTAFVSTKDWESLRHFGIGGSDSSVIMGISPYQTEEGLWYEKVGYPELVADEGRQAVFDRGHFMEPKVIEAFCRMTGAVVIPESRMFQSKKYPHSTANLDAVLKMPSDKLVLFEAKSAVDCFNKIGEWLGENVPPNYVTQTHQYLGVMDDPRVDGVYIGMLPCKDVVLADIYVGSNFDPSRYFHHFEARDEIYESEILAAEDDWWKSHVETGLKPAASKNSKLDRAVAARYTPSPLSDPTIAPVELSYSQYEDLYNRLLSAEEDVQTMKAKLDTVTNFRDTLRDEFIAAMGGSQEALLVDRNRVPLFVLRNGVVRRDGINMESLKQYFPDAYEKCRKPIVYTTFSTKVAKMKKRK